MSSNYFITKIKKSQKGQSTWENMKKEVIKDKKRNKLI